MAHILEVTRQDIEQLSDERLTRLLSMLLYAEAEIAGIPLRYIYVSQKIRVPDGGEDARAKWDDGPSSTNWLPSRYTSYQAKATEMPPAQCAQEILVKGKNQLKPLVEEVLKAHGTYVLFYGRNCGPTQQNTRIAKMREAIKKTRSVDSKKAEIEIFDSNRIAQWTSKIAAASVAVCRWSGKPLPWTAHTWADWSGYPEMRNTPYVNGDTKRDGQLSAIQKFFRGPGRKVARINGLPGLGKSRLAFEAFRPPHTPEDDPEQQLISDKVVYLDASTSEDQMVDAIREWRAEGLSGILIVDNCDTRLHRILAREVRHAGSRLDLLTLGVEPCDGPDDATETIQLVEMEDSIVSLMLKQAYPTLPDGEIEFIAKDLAQGFPQMAVLLANARLGNEADIRKIVHDDLLPRLLRLEGHNSRTMAAVIGACSIVTNLGFLNDAAHEYKFLATFVKIDPNEFYGCVQDLLRAKTLLSYGKYVQVRPKPLAMRLAADWWARCSSERARELMESKIPGGMAEALCDRMSMLDFMPEVQALVKDLCGAQGPFGQAEVLNSELGSRLFRSLVEVNPAATVEALKRVEEKWSKADLLEIGPGRRNLVWALAKLCFWAHTFPDASRIMLRFAASENEDWSNNATGEFLDLFKVLLSGTQAPLNARLPVIDDALGASDEDVQALGIRALGAALESTHFSKMVGVEQQGSRPPQQDYRPKYWQEIFDYWSEVLERLSSIACAKSKHGELARAQIAHQIRGLVSYGRLDILDKVIHAIATSQDGYWPGAVNSIRDVIQYDGAKLPSGGLEKVRSWLPLLEPASLANQLRLYVSEAPFEHEEDSQGRYVDVAAERAIEFAERAARDWKSFLESWKIVFNGPQRQGFVFGKRLGELSPEPLKLVDEALRLLPELQERDANPIVLGGLLNVVSKTNATLTANTLDKIATDDRLVRFLVDLTRCIDIQQRDIDRIEQGVKAERIKSSWLVGISHGRALNNIDPQRMARFCSVLANRSVADAWVALDILFMYAHGDPNRWNACGSSFRDVLMVRGMLVERAQRSNFSIHEFENVSVKLLNSGDEALAVHLANEIVSVCGETRSRYHLDHALVAILRPLLTQYFDQVWPIFALPLLDRGSVTSFHLGHLLGDKHRHGGSGVIDEVPLEKLLIWCGLNRDGPRLIMEMVSAFDETSGHAKLSPQVLELLSRFGDQKEVLSALSANLGTFSWSGSLVPFYERLEGLVTPLYQHPRNEVREWAKRESRYARQEIDKERMREAEHQIGRY